ncbi:MAG: hypothetical protein LC795_09745 [Acidobacteria bacterium]|nr:hypothetical protein [Acidobacteriota bacterium]
MAAKAERRYKVAADNKGNVLVAAQLAEEWEAKKLAVGRLERERDDELAIMPRVIDEETRKAILALAHDLPAIWHSPTTTVVERKELLRFAIQEIALQRAGSVLHVELRWLTGTSHKFEVFLPGTKFSPEADEKDSQILEMVRSLRGNHTHRQIAERLNQAGYSNKRGGSFTKEIVMKIVKRFVHTQH